MSARARQYARFALVPLPEGFDGLSRAAKATWFGLCSFAKWDKDGTGRCYPSQSRLGERVGFGRLSIRRGLEELKNAGLVECEFHEHRASLSYVMRTCIRIRQGCLTIIQGDVSPVTTNNTNRTIQEETLTPEQAMALFQGVWEQFRRFNPDGRAEAKAAFLRLFPAGLLLDDARRRERALLELLNAQAEAWEANIERGEGRFNPRMGNWLRRQSLDADVDVDASPEAAA